MAKCNTLFCDAEQHADDLHADVTGYSWREPVSAQEQVARVYAVSCYSDHAEDIRTKGSCDYCGGVA